jgi:hypothetical protein
LDRRTTRFGLFITCTIGFPVFRTIAADPCERTYPRVSKRGNRHNTAPVSAIQTRQPTQHRARLCHPNEATDTTPRPSLPLPSPRRQRRSRSTAVVLSKQLAALIHRKSAVRKMPGPPDPADEPAFDTSDIRLYRDHSASERYRTTLPHARPRDSGRALTTLTSSQ